MVVGSRTKCYVLCTRVFKTKTWNITETVDTLVEYNTAKITVARFEKLHHQSMNFYCIIH